CPQLTIPETDVDTFDKESFICEDPAVMYEGVSPNPDPVTLSNYLVPFDIEFSKDFLEGKVNLEPEVAKEEESDGESVHSQAPTEIYQSPAPTPRRRLSLVDYTLKTEVTQYDLLKHMKKTLEHLAEKGRADAAQLAFEQKQEELSRSAEARRRRRRLARAMGSVDEKDVGQTEEEKTADETDKADDSADAMESFSFPQFGISPGPTPRSTPAGTPEVLSEAEDVEDVTTEEDTSVRAVTVQVVKTEEKEDEISKYLATEKEKEKENENQLASSPRPKRKFGFSSVTVDAKSLMKDNKKTISSKKEKQRSTLEVDSPRKGGDSDSDTGEKKGKRTERGPKKMAQMSQRKIPKQRKPEKDVPDPREPPPTQMQALEQKEQHQKADQLSRTLDSHVTTKEDFPHVGSEEKRLEGKRRNKLEKQESSQLDKEFEKKAIPSLNDRNNTGEVNTVQAEQPIIKIKSQPFESSSPTNVLGLSETVPALSKPSIAKSRQSSIKADVSDKQFSDMEDGGSLVSKKSQSQGQFSIEDEISFMATSETGAKSVVAETIDLDGRKSALSTEGSEDSKAAFRLSLLSKQTVAEDATSEGGLSPAPPSFQESNKNILPTPQHPLGQASEPYVRECHKDVKYEKPGNHSELGKKSPSLNLKARRPSKPVSSSKTLHGIKTSPSKKLSTSTSHGNHSASQNSTPDDLLAAYFEKQQAKEASKNAVHVLSANEAEEMLKAIGRKKPPSPILEDEGAEEEEENRTGFSGPSVDWVSGRAIGSRSSVTDTLGRPEFGVGRAMSPDASTVRATTPSVSIIENESVWSANSPAASIGRGLNSPLPTLSEVPLASSPIPPSSFNTEIDRRELLCSAKKAPSTSKTSITAGTDLKFQQKSRENTNLKVKDNMSVVSLSSVSESGDKSAEALKNVTDSSYRIERSESISSEMMNSTSLSESKHIFCKVSGNKRGRGDESDSSDIDEADGQDTRKVRSTETTGPAPVEKIDIVRRHSGSEKSLSTIAHSSIANTIVEEDEDIGLEEKGQEHPGVGALKNFGTEDNDAVFNNDILSAHQYANSDMDSSERTWDSDFDASFLGSVGELSSTLSASDEDSKAPSRGGGSASSSSNAEQVMKVRIRKKQLSHHRQRRADRASHQASNVSSPRDPSMALRRMLSQNDALTVQRNAQLEKARYQRKRVKSAIEGSSTHPREQQDGQFTGQGKREHISQCVLCAVEGTGHHADHFKPKALPSGEVVVEKERRRISFKDEAKQSSKPSPRLPRSGRSSVSQPSPRDTGSRRSSLTQPSPRENGSRPSSINQQSPGGSDAKRYILGHRSPRGKKSSRQDGEGRFQTPEGSSKHSIELAVKNHDYLPLRWSYLKQEQCEHNRHWLCFDARVLKQYECYSPWSGVLLYVILRTKSPAPPVTSDPRPSATPDLSIGVRDRTTPTSIETPELSGYARPPSQILSDVAFGSPRESETLREGIESAIGFGSEFRSTVQDDNKVGIPDSGWMDQDIISVSRQNVRSADQMIPSDLDETSDFHRGRPGLSMLEADELHMSQGNALPEVKVRERPNTSVEDRTLQRPELQSALTYFKQRPHTAQVRFKTEDLQTAFDTSLVRYKKLSRNPLTSDTLYRNADQAFSEDWHERQVERHMLIRMQKELRSQNAERRRQAMHARKQEQLQRRLQAQETQLFERRAHPPPGSPALPARASTVHGTRLSAMPAPTPTPVSSRPHTAAGAGDFRRRGMLTNGNRYSQQQQPQQRQHQYNGEGIARQVEAEAGRRLKAELGQEKPFRFKLRESEDDPTPPTAAFDFGEAIDPWLLDPRNPHAMRPKSSKSIPSKCHRYVLVTKPKASLQIPLPSPLEEQLLATRFPQQGEKVFRQYEGLLFRPPRRPEYGINYSPFEHQLYG
ncbi:WD repeat-containing protein 87, partial [Plakobranchus ocellatus]